MPETLTLMLAEVTGAAGAVVPVATVALLVGSGVIIKFAVGYIRRFLGIGA